MPAVTTRHTIARPSAPPAPTAAAQPQILRAGLLRWYDHNARSLPWRDLAAGRLPPQLANTPAIHRTWAVWLSEVMLQQTRVDTVIPRYLQILQRFPTHHALAAQQLDQLLNLWAGLGYYRRARNLHAAARIAAAAGELPSEARQWAKLPGIGTYTAAAIASICNNQPVAAVDGNVIRVIARLHAIPHDVRHPATQRSIQALADQLLCPQRPGDFNQAMMELGATVCTPHNPNCLLCPLNNHCAAQRSGQERILPISAGKPALKPMSLLAVALLAPHSARFLLTQRPADGLWPGLWELPTLEAPPTGARKRLAELLRQRFALNVRVGKRLLRLRHLLTHRCVDLHVYHASLPDQSPPPHLSSAMPSCWATVPEAIALGISTMMKKALLAIPHTPPAVASHQLP